MAKQRSPHVQTEQNTEPERSDFESGEMPGETDTRLYRNIEAAEMGTNRSPKKVRTGPRHLRKEPELVAHEGRVSTRTPKRPVQGITSHSAAEESVRQKKVVEIRPDAQAGVNHNKRKKA